MFRSDRTFLYLFVMSYDLYFHKRKTGGPSESQIAKYLSENVVPANEKSGQWFFQNPDTEVYYSFELEAPGDDPSEEPTYEEFEGFENTHIAFNLNFMRPSFFGLEAFLFVEKFVTDLDLFVLDPQSDKDGPYQPTKEVLFERWNNTSSGNITLTETNGRLNWGRIISSREYSS